MDKLIKVGKYKQLFNQILGISYDVLDIYRSTGLLSHMVNKKHFNALKYVDSIPDILDYPDYIGINPNESGKSIELVKKYKDNIIVGIKLDESNGYYYVSTMFIREQKKIDRFVHSGRLIAVDNILGQCYTKNAENINSDEQEKVPCAPEREPDMVDDLPPTQN